MSAICTLVRMMTWINMIIVVIEMLVIIFINSDDDEKDRMIGMIMVMAIEGGG